MPEHRPRTSATVGHRSSRARMATAAWTTTDRVDPASSWFPACMAPAGARSKLRPGREPPQATLIQEKTAQRDGTRTGSSVPLGRANSPSTGSASSSALNAQPYRVAGLTFRDRQCPGSMPVTGRHLARRWPAESCDHPAGSRPPGVRTQLHAMRLSRTQRDPADTSNRAVSCGNTRPKGAVPDARSPPPRNLGRAGCGPLTCPGSGPQLAHRHRERSPEPLPGTRQAQPADRA